MSDEVALVDTNVLVYAHYRQSEHHVASKALLSRAQAGAIALCVASQVLAEFYSVITNQRRVSPPFEPDEAVEALARLLAMPGISLVPLAADVPRLWIGLAREHAARGPRIFDLQLVATMLANGVRRIYTYDRAHFEPFSEIEVLLP